MRSARIRTASRAAMTSSALQAEAGPHRQTRVAVFARAPVAGQAKTRLIALLGPEGAARLHGELVRHALAVAVASAVGPVELWCAPDTLHPFFDRCSREFGAT